MSYKIAVIASEYNSVIMDRLLLGAKKALQNHEQVTIRVPGAFEIPLAVKRAASSKKYHGVVALGCVLRGETSHFDYISSAVSFGLQQVALDVGVPVGFGLLTVDTVQQAMDRSSDAGNKGFEAASTALEMIDVLQRI